VRDTLLGVDGPDLFLDGVEVSVAGSPLYSTRGDYRMVDKAVLDTPACWCTL